MDFFKKRHGGAVVSLVVSQELLGSKLLLSYHNFNSPFYEVFLLSTLGT